MDLSCWSLVLTLLRDADGRKIEQVAAEVNKHSAALSYHLLDSLVNFVTFLFFYNVCVGISELQFFLLNESQDNCHLTPTLFIIQPLLE
jgi:hypothetical protein